ncbi:hypothetical protein [Lacticaseibacillus porcinae]|uniref:hypothetical protein n=1 Tax=Lacticaseibacillus porcinae TaxID=1123687 RepID=UPI000F76F87B|nr:hypothetical protein [Lacticaseibacillus porcinae]
MKKLLGVLLLWVSFWFVGLSTVHAETQPLPPDYDPIQGGMVFRPPKDLWIKADNSVAIIPIAYLPGGPLKPSELSQASYHVTVNGKGVPVQPITNPSQLEFATPSELSLGAINTGGLGIIVRTNSTGDYALKIVMNINQDSNNYETEMILHAREQISAITWADTSFKAILSPLPQLVLWHHLYGEVTVEDGTITSTISSSAFKWPSTPSFYMVTPSSVDTTAIESIRLSAGQLQLTVAGGVATQQFGLLPITLTNGQPLILDFDYIKPNPGTKLEFVWKFHQQVPDITMPDIVTDTPSLNAAQVQKASGSLQLVLRYSNAQSTVEYRSSVITYVYRPSSQPFTQSLLPPANATVSLPAIIQGPVTVNAGLADWQVNQPGMWRLTINISNLKQADGARLQADLKWPNGTLITPTQPYSASYNGQQLLPLSQIDWVFQQQPLAKAGHYQAEIQIQAISGP